MPATRELMAEERQTIDAAWDRYLENRNVRDASDCFREYLGAVKATGAIATLTGYRVLIRPATPPT